MRVSVRMALIAELRPLSNGFGPLYNPIARLRLPLRILVFLTTKP